MNVNKVKLLTVCFLCSGRDAAFAFRTNDYDCGRGIDGIRRDMTGADGNKKARMKLRRPKGQDFHQTRGDDAPQQITIQKGQNNMNIKKFLCVSIAAVMTIATVSAVALADETTTQTAYTRESNGKTTWNFASYRTDVNVDLGKTGTSTVTSYYKFDTSVSEISNSALNDKDTLYITSKNKSTIGNKITSDGLYITYTANAELCYTSTLAGTLTVYGSSEKQNAGVKLTAGDNAPVEMRTTSAGGSFTAPVSAAGNEKITIAMVSEETSASAKVTISKIVFTPAFTSVEATKTGEKYTEYEGDAAQAYGVTLSPADAVIPTSLQWVVTKSGNKGTKKIEDMPNINGAGDVKFGLILTGTSDELDNVTSVRLAAIGEE